MSRKPLPNTHGARFTRDFEDWVAWLAVRCTASAVSELARVEWHSVGGVCRRVYAELEAARGASRFDGVRRIGIDETSYKKGHKYVTVVVDHDRGCLIWAHEGTGKDVLNLFLDELTLFLIAFIFRKSRDKSFGFHDDCFAS